MFKHWIYSMYQDIYVVLKFMFSTFKIWSTSPIPSKKPFPLPGLTSPWPLALWVAPTSGPHSSRNWGFQLLKVRRRTNIVLIPCHTFIRLRAFWKSLQFLLHASSKIEAFECSLAIASVTHQITSHRHVAASLQNCHIRKTADNFLLPFLSSWPSPEEKRVEREEKNF